MSQYSTSNLAALQTKEGNLFGTVFRASIEKLIATKLDRFGIEEVDYVLTILDRIAYTAHKQKTYPIDWELIEEQIEEYNKKYKYSYSPTDVVQCLEESRILRHNSDKYEFCQVSYYTFFIARQIKYLWQEKGNNEDFIEALRMAFLPINSSIVLFVTYIMDSEMLMMSGS